MIDGDFFFAHRQSFTIGRNFFASSGDAQSRIRAKPNFDWLAAFVRVRPFSRLGYLEPEHPRATGTAYAEIKIATVRMEAISIQGNRILAVGSNADIIGHKDRHTRVIDAQMNTVVPGIINALNLAHRGVYNELQSIPPGGVWRESFWIRPSGF